MQTFDNRKDLQACIELMRAQGDLIGFVPTMGTLHEGHFSLVQQSLSACDHSVVSIYVNPKQFNNAEDYEAYPRQVESDLVRLQSVGVNAVYLPTFEELFSEENPATALDLHGLDVLLEGASRPGHFRGVVEVVYALLQHVKPDKLFLGLKDYQQVLVIKNMVSDLSLPLSVVACETQRAPNGLALSSRNQRLSMEQQAQAAVLYRVLTKIKNNQKSHTPSELLAQGIEELTQASLVVDYLVVVDAQSLITLDSFGPHALACVAATCHGVRLIDNMPLWGD